MSEMKHEGQMEKITGKIRSFWADLTDDDVEKAKGDREQMVGTIKEKTGQAEEDIRRKLDEFDQDPD